MDLHAGYSKEIKDSKGKIPIVWLVQAALVSFPEMKHVNIGSKNRIYVAHTRINTNWNSAVDPCYWNPITRLDAFNQITVGKQRYGAGSLTSRHFFCKLMISKSARYFPHLLHQQLKLSEIRKVQQKDLVRFLFKNTCEQRNSKANLVTLEAL